MKNKKSPTDPTFSDKLPETHNLLFFCAEGLFLEKELRSYPGSKISDSYVPNSRGKFVSCQTSVPWGFTLRCRTVLQIAQKSIKCRIHRSNNCLRARLSLKGPASSGMKKALATVTGVINRRSTDRPLIYVSGITHFVYALEIYSYEI